MVDQLCDPFVWVFLAELGSGFVVGLGCWSRMKGKRKNQGRENED